MPAGAVDRMSHPGAARVGPASPAPLGARAIAVFRRDGLLLVRGALAPAVAADLDAAVGLMLRDAGPEATAWYEIADMGAAADAHLLAACARTARLEALVEPLVGPGGAMWSGALVFASERGAAAATWRQDGAAWPPHRIETVSVRVALDRVDRDNGCPRLLPRSHERLVREIRNARDPRRLALPLDRIDPTIVVEAVRDRGEITLYDGRTFRCEPPNRSGRRRAAVVFRYAPAESRGEATRADPR
jgi:hypothetical protein